MAEPCDHMPALERLVLLVDEHGSVHDVDLETLAAAAHEVRREGQRERFNTVKLRAGLYSELAKVLDGMAHRLEDAERGTS